MRAGKRDHRHLEALDCGHGLHRCMAGWGNGVVLGICPAESSSAEVGFGGHNMDYEAASIFRRDQPTCGEVGIDHLMGAKLHPFPDAADVQDAATLLRVYLQAAGEWESHVGRRLLEVAPTKEVGLNPEPSGVDPAP